MSCEQAAMRHRLGRPADTGGTCRRFDSGTTKLARQRTCAALIPTLAITTHCHSGMNEKRAPVTFSKQQQILAATPSHLLRRCLLDRQAPSLVNRKVLLHPGWACMLQSCALVGSPAACSSRPAAVANTSWWHNQLFEACWGMHASQTCSAH